MIEAGLRDRSCAFPCCSSDLPRARVCLLLALCSRVKKMSGTRIFLAPRPWLPTVTVDFPYVAGPAGPDILSRACQPVTLRQLFRGL